MGISEAEYEWREQTGNLGKSTKWPGAGRGGGNPRDEDDEEDGLF